VPTPYHIIKNMLFKDSNTVLTSQVYAHSFVSTIFSAYIYNDNHMIHVALAVEKTTLIISLRFGAIKTCY